MVSAAAVHAWQRRSTTDRLVGEEWQQQQILLAMRRFTEFINTRVRRSRRMRSGSPDIQWTLEEMVAEGDRVAARFMMRGTHHGVFFGVPPTGRPINVQAMNFYRFADGQITEERGQPDLLDLLRQIGALPS
jgi:steroid delta-isomerase-like uncharacterized protein